ncbi:hypothetical protein F5Y19DRAFT_463267 [Xylariaceae sp. FL1651]|nr:hypothetical protein F5Y19DRAFT_463267 [Xylariaceae sp. FL1651]
MHVLASEVKPIIQADELMQGAILTVSAVNSSESRTGVFWSLPLSRMRYYSPPIIAERQVTTDTSRVPLSEFRVVCLGIIFASWMTACSDADRLSRFVAMFFDRLGRHKLGDIESEIRWLRVLRKAAEDYRNSEGIQRQRYYQLLTLGQRRPGNFLIGPSEGVPVLFGLQSFKTLFNLFSEDEHIISVLRKIARKYDSPPGSLIIRYRRTNSRSSRIGSKHFDYCTALPEKPKIVDSSTTFFTEGHCRWVIGKPRRRSFKIGTNPRTFPARKDPLCRCGGTCPSCYNDIIKNEMTRCNEDWSFISVSDTQELGRGAFSLRRPGYDEMFYEVVLGDANTYALFQSGPAMIVKHTRPAVSVESTPTIGHVEEFLSSPGLDSVLLRSYARRSLWTDRSTHDNAPLRALAQLNQIYESLEGARIHLGVLKLPLCKAKWAQKTTSFTDKINSAFACIAMMESGEFNIKPSSLENVMAVSSGDSIFVPSALLRDPFQAASSHRVTRVFGNVGRSEIVFMASPAQPALKAVEPGSWRLIQHQSFDGEFLDSFVGTSLHLSFTDFQLPLDVGPRGFRDKQALLLEAVISLNYGGTHYGDLDVISAFAGLISSTLVNSYPKSLVKDSDINGIGNGKCEHGFLSGNPVTISAADKAELQEKYKNILTSLDCWEEFFDPPCQGAGIFRAAGNWEARLAAFTVAKKLNRRVLVLPPNACISCLERYGDFSQIDIVIA